MNKKAQIPMILIPLITIVLVLTALFAFASFNNNIEKLSGELSKLTEDIIFNQQYIIAQAKLITNETIESCQNCNPEQLKAKFQEITKQKEELFRYPPAENFYGKIHRGEFEITQTALTINEIFTESKIEKHKIRRNFDIELNLPKRL